MSAVANIASSLQKEQSGRLTSYKPKKQEIPSDYRSAIHAQNTPPPPGKEAFTMPTPWFSNWLLVVGAASVAFVLLTTRWNKRL